MGKGDKKTRKGKIFMHSYGKLRPKRKRFRIRFGKAEDMIKP